jgi:protein-S-isoprenylcysteine O-methyltransferase Ste14
MRATAFEFRHRVLIITVIIFVGFFSPGFHGATVWMLLSGWLAHWTVLGMKPASLAVGVIALGCAFLGACFRTWGTAYLGRGIMLSPRFHSDAVVAAGPYRHLRNPLYVGAELNFLALALLMPLPGAIFTVVLLVIFLGRIIAAEEFRLAGTPGYAEYHARVPRLLPSLRPRTPDSGATPRWGPAMIAEIYYWGTVISFAVFLPRYNAGLITRGILASLGVSLIARGFLPRAKNSTG